MPITLDLRFRHLRVNYNPYISIILGRPLNKWYLNSVTLGDSKITRCKDKMRNFYILGSIWCLVKTQMHMYLCREVLFEFHLKFWNTTNIGIPVRSLLWGRPTCNWSNCSTKRNNCSMVFKQNISTVNIGITDIRLQYRKTSN